MLFVLKSIVKEALCVKERRHAEKGLKIHRDSGAEAFLSLGHCLLGSIHLGLGDLENALSHAEEALRLSQENNEKAIEGLS